MSRLKLHNLILILPLALFFLPLISHAKTFSLADQTWNIEETIGKNVKVVSVRNDFSLLSATQSAFSKTPTTTTAPLLTTETIDQINKITREVTKTTEEPKLVIKNNRAVEFAPGQNGQTIDLFKFRGMILSDLPQPELPIVISKPQTSLAETNDLGISELVAVGESDFSGSPANRIHNVTVGAFKFNGILIAPGEEFSFNKHLGDVDAEHGFLPELVIKSGSLIPEFGGGLCQVSSTTFRAAMNAGVPITARRNHSFAVQYYAPQGTDATIYPGAVDFKFVNNLPGHILMRTKIVGRKLFFELYGTKDQRQVAFEGPITYDKKTDGSMKTYWTRHVTDNGAVTTQTFNSTYQPPALFKRVTTVEPSTPNPQSETPPSTEPETINEPTT